MVSLFLTHDIYVSTTKWIFFVLTIAGGHCLKCYNGVSFIPDLFPQEIETRRCSIRSDICRVTTLYYGSSETTHTSYSCDKEHIPCDLRCDLEMTVDESIEKCETFCCKSDFCNQPGNIDVITSDNSQINIKESKIHKPTLGSKINLNSNNSKLKGLAVLIMLIAIISSILLL